MKLKTHILWLLPLFFTSCWSAEFLKTDESTTTYPLTHPDSIEVYSTDSIGREYTVIGIVNASVDAGNDAEFAVRFLRKEAGKLGADAIINLRLEFGYGFWVTGLMTSGTAVKYVK